MRFSLLYYEPYVTLLQSSELTLHMWQRGSIPIGELEEKLLSEIRQKYRGENIDYINFVIKEKFKELLFLSRIGSIKLFSQYSYASFVGHAVRLLTKELIDRLQIRSLQDFKFVTIYIEPNILLIRNLIEERFDFVIYNEKFCLNLIEFFLPKKYPYIDLHVHAETSYQFSALMETTVRNFSSLFSEILKRERVKKKKILPKLNAIVEYFFHTCCSFRTFSEKKIILRATNFSLKKSYNSFVLQRFNYHEFLHSLLRKLKSFENGSFSKNVSPLIEVLILQLLNEIYASISFTGEYKGLKYMAKNFKHPIKKAYQEKREVLFKRKDDPIISSTFSSYTTSGQEGERDSPYIEIRFSLEKEPLKYWHEKTKEFNVYFILHYQKIDEPTKFNDYYKLKKFLLKQWNLTQDLYIFLVREIEKERRRGKKQKNAIFNRIVGFDAASVEYWTPPWLYRVFFGFWKLFFKLFLKKELLLTFHAGEDFVDIATGLRYVYESVYFLNVHRLGHAMSLGVAIEKYLYRYSRVVVRPIVYFYHLLWLHHLTVEYEELSIHNKEILQEIERFLSNYGLQELIDPLSDIIQQNSPLKNSSLFLNSLYKSLGFFDFLYDKTFQDGKFHIIFNKTFSQEFPDILLAMRLNKIVSRIHREIGNSSQEFEALVPLLSNSSGIKREKQIKILYKIQEVLIELVNTKRIFIESCPSSNIILYNISSFLNHPLLGKRNLLTTINTDNPLIVGTNIQLEYAIAEEIFSDKDAFEEVKNNSKLAKAEKLS